MHNANMSKTRRSAQAKAADALANEAQSWARSTTKSYRYHAFVSYRHDPNYSNWMQWVVSKFLKPHLRNELGGDEPAIFFDTKSINTGDDWNKELRDGLLSSQTIIPFWSPAYFRSPWCRAESETFLRRGRGLIVPIAVHTGSGIPEWARRLLWLDLSDYYLTGNAFWTVPESLALQKSIKSFTRTLAARIKKAPPFRADFPITDPEVVSNSKARSNPIRLKPRPTRSRTKVRPSANVVFLNLPHTSAYGPLHQAIVFAVMSCGFMPRSVLEVDVSKSRLESIVRFIQISPLSIHDVSSFDAPPSGNVTLELGITLGVRAARPRLSALVLSNNRDLDRQLSDLSGLDVAIHGGDPEVALSVVANWLATHQQKGQRIAAVARISDAYRQFKRSLPAALRGSGISPDELTFKDLVLTTAAWINHSGL